MKEQTFKLERVTRKWWFYSILLVAQLLILPFATRNFDFSKIRDIISTVLSNSFQAKMHDYYPYFQIIAIIVLFLLLLLRNRFAKVFNIYVLFSYTAFAILQNIASTDTYGLSIITINVLMFLFVAYTWLKEVLKPENDYSFGNFNWKDVWMIPLAFIAFWYPLSNGVFDFKLKHFLDSGSSLGFCFMTPVFLTIMTFNIPEINIVTYRITALIGVIIGFYNMLNFQNPELVNVAILHFPLLFISIYSLIRSYLIKQPNLQAKG